MVVYCLCVGILTVGVLRLYVYVLCTLIVLQVNVVKLFVSTFFLLFAMTSSYKQRVY